MRHPDQILQAIDGWTENVAFGTNETTIYLIYRVKFLILAIQLESGRGQSTTCTFSVATRAFTVGPCVLPTSSFLF